VVKPRTKTAWLAVGITLFAANETFDWAMTFIFTPTTLLVIVVDYLSR